LEVADHEADDVIATLAEKSMMNEDYNLILSNDKDILQLVNDEHTCVMKVAKNRDGFNDFVFMDERSVYDKHGVRPDQIPDFLAMVGDKPDNITGIPGVGAKTAAKLLEDHGSIENLIANSDSLKGKLKEKVQSTKEDLMKFKEITVLWRDLDVPAIEDLQAGFNYYELSDELGLSVDDMAFWEQIKQQAQGNDVDLIQDDNNPNTAPVFKF
jgi:DNA polymerase-1